MQEGDVGGRRKVESECVHCRSEAVWGLEERVRLGYPAPEQEEEIGIGQPCQTKEQKEEGHTMPEQPQPLVGVVMGSKSDLEWGQQVGRYLQELGIPHELRILSAHRTPVEAANYAQSAAERGLAVIIAIAGLAAHLPGVLAAYTWLPVIGLPLAGGPLRGQDALYAMVQMPPGVPVATVGLDNPRNAAVLAAQILAVRHSDVRVRLQQWRREQTESVRLADRQLQQSSATAVPEPRP